MPMIYKGKNKTVRGKKQYEVRMLGFEFWIKEDEFNRAVRLGQVFYKANKPVNIKQIMAAA